MKTIDVLNDDGEPRPVHEIATDFTNEFMNDVMGLPVVMAANRLGLELCTLISNLRGEDAPDDRFSVDDDCDECTDPNCMYPH